MSAALWLTVASALLASLLVSWMCVRAGVLDLPNARSAHAKPTPRAAGLGVLAGLGAGLMTAAFTPLSAGDMAGLLAVTGFFAALGLADDLFDLSEQVKFILFLALCLAMVFAAGPVTRLPLTLDIGLDLPVWLGVAGSALFIFTVVNAVNFMDGSDGMLPAVMAPAAAGLAVAGLVAGATSASLIGAALAAGLIGFAIFNHPPAKAFAGDVGALAAGAAYAGAALAMAGKGFSGSLWLAPLFVLVFLADVLLTLLRRARYGRLKLTAHREHAYQRLIQKGWSHGRLALIYGGLTVAIVLTGLAAAQGPDGAVVAAFLFWVLILTALYRVAGRIAPGQD